jgi:uncharacterized membrane protein HdeD (DUF308 family)
MRDMLSKMWWAVLLRGLCGIAFGILAFTMPGLTLATLVMLFGVAAIVGGAFEMIGAISAKSQSDDWWIWLLQGAVGVIVGVLTFRIPGVTTLVLMFFISVWAFATGVLQIIAAIRLRKEIKGEGWLMVSGLASIALAIILMANPAAGALGLIYYIGAVALITGIVMTLLAFRVKGAVKTVKAAMA